jgi:riboflavin transporter FmnP
MTIEVPDEPVPLRALTFLEEGDEVTVGCVSTGSYIVLPGDGADLIRKLAAGLSQREVAAWYRDTYGEQVDVADFVVGLDEAGLLRPADEIPDTASPVRWQRLGKAVFSAAGGVCLAGLLTAWCALMLRYPAFVPSYRQIFFTQYLTVIELAIFIGQIPLVLIHEAAHALAGRRLGLPTSLSVGRRLYYIVFVTSMDSLVGVERRKRYLPMLAGMLTDLAVCAVLNVIAWLTMGPGGQLTLTGKVALAFSLATLLRIAWQFYFYLQTDLYYVAVTVMRCVDLQMVARQMLRDRFRRLLRHDGAPAGEPAWHPRDRAVARWYSWLMLGGYAFSIGSLGVVGVPAAIRTVSLCVGAVRTGQLRREADISIFLVLNLAQFLFLGYLMLRDRRRRRAPRLAAA